MVDKDFTGADPRAVTITNDPPVSVQVSTYGCVRAENPRTGVHEPAIAPEKPADITMIWLEVARCTRQLSQGNSAGYFKSFQKLPV